MRTSGGNRRAGFTLIELLVVIAIISLLLSVLLPALSAARNEGLRAKSAANLRSIAQIGGTTATEDDRGIIHKQSESGKINWIGLGEFDFGGADTQGDGAEKEWMSELGGAGYHLGAVTRPYNRALYGANLTRDSDFSQFFCPGEEGLVPKPPGQQTVGYDGLGYPNPLLADESVFKLFGTSYIGEFVNYGGSSEPRYHFGTFMRPSNLIPDTGVTTLFYEARFAQAFTATREAVQGGLNFAGAYAADVQGSFKTIGSFNVAFADGHADKVIVRKRETMSTPLSFDGVVYPYRASMARGPNWRFDCYPAPFVTEWFGDQFEPRDP